MTDFLVRGSLARLDPDVFELTQLEAERQARKLILIPSESTTPLAVREAMGSAFQNIYAEGYPDEDSRTMSEAEILDYPERLANFRRNSDPRYYKGTEYADVVEALARRRSAEAFATNGVKPDQLFVNVQGPIGRTRQQRRLSRPHRAGQRRHGPQPAARRAPLARLVRQPERQVLQDRPLQR